MTLKRDARLTFRDLCLSERALLLVLDRVGNIHDLQEKRVWVFSERGKLEPINYSGKLKEKGLATEKKDGMMIDITITQKGRALVKEALDNIRMKD